MIRIDEDTIIEIENENYTAKIEKHKQDKNGNEVTELIGYYRSLNSALKGILRYKTAKALDEGEKSLHEAISTVVRVENEFKKVIEKALGDM